jgi:hypothetical protein
MMYISRGPSEKLPAGECAIQGGRFAFPGQTRYDKALLVWMPDAKAGDKIAQNYVGEIYQRGMGGSPQYALAAKWFRKAADQGLTRAQMNLAHLYEKGLGVEKDPQQAMRLFRLATGLGDSISLDENVLSIEERQELQELREENKRRNEETSMLQQKLERIQKDLEDARRKLKQPISDPKDETQRQEAARLKKQIADDEKIIKELSDKLAQNEAKLNKLPAPFIEIFDPIAQTTRGADDETYSQDSKKRIIAGKVWAPAGLAGFEVNQKPVAVEPDGKFSLRVPVNPSSDTIVLLVAVDQRGKSTRITHKLARSVGISDTGSADVDYSSIKFGRYYGLIIGNIDYSKISKLKTAVNDAKKVAEILRDKYGFNTKLLLNASREDIIRALDKFRTTLTENDNLLIYYAGHGFLDTKNNRGYWQPVDADPDSIANWIPNEAITDMLNIMSAKKVLIIADSCYSGSLTRGVVAQLESAKSDEVRFSWIEELSKGKARMVLTSGELKPVLDAGGGGHSVFAKVLLEVLESNDEVIEGDRLHQQINALVVYESEKYGLTQIPQYAANTQAGHESGDFIFVPKK